MDSTRVFGASVRGFKCSPYQKYKFAPIVKWISQTSSERLCRVRVLVGAPLNPFILGACSDFNNRYFFVFYKPKFEPPHTQK